MPFRKKNCSINLEKGKSLYYHYYGSIFGMCYDLGTEYADCNIPKEIEIEWKKDILDKLEKEISTAQGDNLHLAVSRYIDLLPADTEWLMQLLQTREMDTFTAIIFCEQLKNMSKIDIIKSIVVRRFLDDFKVKLFSQPITIHQTYKNAVYMRDYDFSHDNIIKRINEI